MSWTPEARETWAQMRPEHQQEVARRELEISQTLTRTAEVRRFAEDFERVVNPFMGFIAAENSTPLQAVQHLMQTAAILRIGTPQQKVKAAADIINQYGIDLEMLDSALAGVAPPPGAQPNDDVVQRAVQQAIAPFATQMQRVQQMQTQQVTQEAEAELQAFQANPANEFYADVANDMADLMELAQRRGVILSLQDAYSRATLAHPSISKVLEGRKRSQGVAQQTAAAQRAKAAAASVSSDIAPSRNDDQDADVDDLRATLRASVAAVAQRK